MRNYYLILFFLCVCNLKVSAQNDYILKGDTLQTGIKIVSAIGSNRFHYVVLQEGEKEVKYTPQEISEYGESGKVYEAKLNPLKNGPDYVYMERLIHNDVMSVYYYRDKAGKHYFFQQPDGKLLPINKETNPYADFLYGAERNCEEDFLNDYHIKPTRSSILHSYKLFSTCNPNIIRRVRFGPWIGAGLSNLSSGVVKDGDSESHFFAGIFLDIPVKPLLGISLRPELYYMKESILSSADLGNSYEDVTFNRESVVFPWLVRYTFIKGKGECLPFLNAGPSIHYVLKKEVNRRNLTQLESGVGIRNESITDKANYFQLGMSLGGGLEYKINKKHSLFVDLRYSLNFDKDNANLVFMSVSYNL